MCYCKVLLAYNMLNLMELVNMYMHWHVKYYSNRTTMYIVHESLAACRYWFSHSNCQWPILRIYGTRLCTRSWRNVHCYRRYFHCRTISWCFTRHIAEMNLFPYITKHRFPSCVLCRYRVLQLGGFFCSVQKFQGTPDLWKNRRSSGEYFASERDWTRLKDRCIWWTITASQRAQRKWFHDHEHSLFLVFWPWMKTGNAWPHCVTSTEYNSKTHLNDERTEAASGDSNLQSVSHKITQLVT